MMVQLLGADVVDDEEQVQKTNGAHTHFGFLRKNFKACLRESG